MDRQYLHMVILKVPATLTAFSFIEAAHEKYKDTGQLSLSR
jgi:hypothetical protein